METIVKKIKAEALRLGFSFIQFTSLNSPPHYQAFIQWLGKGYAGDMQYLSRSHTVQSRKNPASLLEGAKSIIVFGFHYPPQTIRQPSDALIGRIASYAVNDDYHPLLKQKAHALMQNVSQQTDMEIEYRVFVDSAPLMEKDTAHMAGLGWIGKHSLLITPSFGSFQVIGCILTDLDIPPAEPFLQDLCGSCRACIQTCPTSCISEQHVIDASRCIAYLTIEHKGIIPRELRSSMGQWIFGCDACQNICPINRKIYCQELPAGSQFSQRVKAEINLLEEVSLTPGEFKQKYGNTPILRAKYEGFTRNIIVALGNSKSSLAIPSLAAIMQTNPSWLLRLHAAWALGEIHTSQSRDIIQAQLNSESNENVLEELRLALQNFN